MSEVTIPADAPRPVPPAPARAPQQEEGVRVVIEQVLVAFILAFIFRAFVLEAFVIPTGSMASTLLGAHMRFTCSDCGWHFHVNYPTDAATQSAPSYAQQIYAIRCPNCGYRFPPVIEEDPEKDAAAPAVSYGDRILVLKHAYLLQEPQRWHVVVFKNPSRGGEASGHLPSWSTEPYQQNYIKRLIGLPGETLMLVDGDVYVTTAQKTLAELRPADFQIARKDDVAQSALWRAVYHDDFRPQGCSREYLHRERTFRDPPWQMPWRTGAGWSVNPGGAGGGFDFAADGVAGALRFDPQANPDTFALTDFLAYNINANNQLFHREPPRTDTFERDFRPTFTYPEGPFRFNSVSDLRLAFFYEKSAGDGPLLLRLTKRGDVFEAEIRDGMVRITGVSADNQPMFGLEAPVEGDFSRPRYVEFINADYRVQLRIDGRTVLETDDADYAPDVESLVRGEHTPAREQRPEVSIIAADQEAQIRHLSLWRDVYYTARDQLGNFTNPYASPYDFPSNIVRLNEGEYFTLGDNPFLSGDARGWTDGIHLEHEGGLALDGGRVPERFMLGRAFFVYWPSSFRPGPRFPAIVPNFGEMRFIR